MPRGALWRPWPAAMATAVMTGCSLRRYAGSSDGSVAPESKESGPLPEVCPADRLSCCRAGMWPEGPLKPPLLPPAPVLPLPPLPRMRAAPAIKLLPPPPISLLLPPPSSGARPVSP
jgi:hypothetical protein